MRELNFPSYTLADRIDEQKKLIFDRVRNKIIPLTPEEWVRQHCLELLTSNFDIPRSRITVERQITLNQRPKRIDIASFDKNGKPQILVECKAPEISVSADTLLQIGWYNTKLDTPYLWLTNGLDHYWFQRRNNVYAQIRFPRSI